jgi:ubiquinone/menaquinone biosynthesis C-methylase UbiE
MGEWTGDESICFDRIADRYDETRGGLRRGRQLADAMEPFIGEVSRILEVGVGSGVMAAAFHERGRAVVGVDISRAMLHHAHAKVGPRVAQADAHHLPFGSGRLDAAYLVWVLHLVADPGAVVRECARVVRSGGRVLVVGGQPHTEGSDMSPLYAALDVLRSMRLRADTAENVRSWGGDAGLEVVEVIETDERFEQTPADAAQQIEDRVFSFLWDIDDQAWGEVAQPVVDSLRALPEPDRARPFRQRRNIHVFGR